MDWQDNRHARWIEMLRLKNRINQMPTSRWPYKVLQWDRVTNTKAWFNDIKLILKEVELTNEHDYSDPVDLTSIASMLQSQAREQWKQEAHTKSKLETYTKIHNFEQIKSMVKCNLSRSQRSIMTKFKAGILPIRFETARYKGLDRNLRFCEICLSGEIENEIHFLTACSKTKYVRMRHKVARECVTKIENGADAFEVLKDVMSNNIKGLACWVEDTWVERKHHLYT